MFISKETGESLSVTEAAQTIPKQVPWGVDPDEIQRNAEMTSTMVTCMMIFQIILSLFLKGAMNDLWGLFFTLQMMCYLTIYDTVIPSSAEMYLKEITKIIEFEIFSPEGFMKIIDPEFDLKAFISGQKVRMNKDQEASVLNDLQVYILFGIGALILLIISIIARVVLKKYKDKIKSRVHLIRDLMLKLCITLLSKTTGYCLFV